MVLDNFESLRDYMLNIATPLRPRIINKIYKEGIGPKDPLSREQISEILEIPLDRLRRIEFKALRKIKHLIRKTDITKEDY